jgi:hypothetical protein
VLFEVVLLRVVEPLSAWLMPVVDVSEEPDPRTTAQAGMAANGPRPMDLARVSGSTIR